MNDSCVQSESTRIKKAIEKAGNIIKRQNATFFRLYLKEWKINYSYLIYLTKFPYFSSFFARSRVVWILSYFTNAMQRSFMKSVCRCTKRLGLRFCRRLPCVLYRCIIFNGSKTTEQRSRDNFWCAFQAILFGHSLPDAICAARGFQILHTDRDVLPTTVGTGRWRSGLIENLFHHDGGCLVLSYFCHHKVIFWHD